MSSPGGTLDRRGLAALFADNVASAMGARVLYLATRLMLPAIVLQHVSLAEFGVWSICFVLIANVGMTAFGLANAYVKDVAERHARGDLGGVSRTFSTGLMLILALSALLLPALWLALPTLIEFFRIDATLAPTAKLLILGSVTVFMLDLSLGSFVYLLHGLQRLRLANAIWVASFMLETLLIVVFLELGFGIVSLLWAFALRYVASGVAYFAVARRLVPGLRIDPRLFSRESLRLFAGFGLVTQLAGMVSMFLRSVEKLLAGALVGVQATAVFEIGEKFPSTAPSIPGAFNSASYPAFAYLHAQRRHAELAALYLRNARYINCVAGAAMGLLAAFADPLLAAWLGPSTVPAGSAFVMVLFTLPFQLDVLTGPGSSAFRGIGTPRRELVYHLTQLAMVAAAVPTLIAAGVDAFAAIAWGVAGSMVTSAVVYIAYCNRVLGIGQLRYALAVLPGFLPYAIAAAVAVLARRFADPDALSRLELLGWLTTAGAAYGFTLLALFVVAFADESERKALTALRARLQARLPRTAS